MNQVRVKVTKQYERNLKKLKKKHYPLELIDECLDAIVNDNSVVRIQIRDHFLRGNWKGYREFYPGTIGKTLR